MEILWMIVHAKLPGKKKKGFASISVSSDLDMRTLGYPGSDKA